MKYYLNTDICIIALTGQLTTIKKRFQCSVPDHIKIPSLVQSELLVSAFKSVKAKEAVYLVERFLEPYEIIPFDSQAAIAYARIRYDFEKTGKSIVFNNLMIAATVAANQGTLVTHNNKEFQQIPGLLTEDWTV